MRTSQCGFKRRRKRRKAIPTFKLGESVIPNSNATKSLVEKEKTKKKNENHILGKSQRRDTHNRGWFLCALRHDILRKQIKAADIAIPQLARVSSVWSTRPNGVDHI